MESLCAYQWNESTRHKASDYRTLGTPFSPHQVLFFAVADGYYKASAGRELVDQRLRYAR